MMIKEKAETNYTAVTYVTWALQTWATGDCPHVYLQACRSATPLKQTHPSYMASSPVSSEWLILDCWPSRVPGTSKPL